MTSFKQYHNLYIKFFVRKKDAVKMIIDISPENNVRNKEIMKIDFVYTYIYIHIYMYIYANNVNVYTCIHI